MALLEEGDSTRSKEVVEFLIDNFIKENIRLDFSALATVDLLYRHHQIQQANTLAEALYQEADEFLSYYSGNMPSQGQQIQIQLFVLRRLFELANANQQSDLAAKCADKFEEYYTYLTTSFN